MKINKWLIHKLGGFAKEDILPPPKYTIENLKAEKFRTYFIDTNTGIPEEYIMDRLVHDFLPMIKDNMKVIKEINDYGEVVYHAEIRVVRNETEWP